MLVAAVLVRGNLHSRCKAQMLVQLIIVGHRSTIAVIVVRRLRATVACVACAQFMIGVVVEACRLRMIVAVAAALHVERERVAGGQAVGDVGVGIAIETAALAA